MQFQGNLAAWLAGPSKTKRQSNPKSMLADIQRFNADMATPVSFAAIDTFSNPADVCYSCWSKNGHRAAFATAQANTGFAP